MKIKLLFGALSLLLFASCVTNEVTSITADKSSVALTLGQTDSVVITIAATGDINKQPVSITSSTSGIVSIENESTVNSATKNNNISSYRKTIYFAATKKGTTTISVQAGEKTATMQITVSDEIRPAMTQGDLWFYGDVYDTQMSNNFTLYLGSAGIDMETLEGNGEVMYLELNTASDVTNYIPAGTYEVAEYDSNTFLPGTLVPGYVDEDETPWGTWYFGSTSNDIVAGSATISVTNNIYSITYVFVDYYGNTISGTFNGAISYYDAASGAPAYVKNSLKAKRAKASGKTMRLKR